MKKMLSLLFLSLCFHYTSIAQVLNGGFELTRSDGTLANWELRTQFAVPLDSPACTFDSLYFRTNDPHEGKYALELRNIACNGILAAPRIAASDDIPAYGPSEPFAGRPQAFSFYYKFFPLNGEGIRMSISLLDADLQTIAIVDSTFFPGTVSAYTRALLPLQYTGGTAAERMTLQFFITDSGGGTGSLQGGARLVIDDIAPTDAVTAIAETGAAKDALKCYPSLATDRIYVQLGAGAGPARVTVLDAGGRTMKRLDNVSLSSALAIPVADLPAGMYFVAVAYEGGRAYTRFVRR